MSSSDAALHGETAALIKQLGLADFQLDDEPDESGRGKKNNNISQLKKKIEKDTKKKFEQKKTLKPVDKKSSSTDPKLLTTTPSNGIGSNTKDANKKKTVNTKTTTSGSGSPGYHTSDPKKKMVCIHILLSILGWQISKLYSFVQRGHRRMEGIIINL